MIQQTFYDGNPEDRRYVDDFWSWLKEQPMDAWLLYIRNANLDNADRILGWMIDDERCDRSIVAWAFWTYAGDVASPSRKGLASRIAGNIGRGWYRDSALELDRIELVHGVHEWLGALQKNAAPPFRLPRELCGPFEGRQARLPASYDAETEKDLADLFRYLDGYLPRSEAEHREKQEKGGNFWIRDVFRLPRVPKDAAVRYASLDDAAYAEAIFGRHADYLAARRSAQGKNAIGPRERWILKILLVGAPLLIGAALLAHRLRAGSW